jgi:beta-mannosidase
MAVGVPKRRSRRKSSRTYSCLVVGAALLTLGYLPNANGLHHMKRRLPPEEPRKEKRDNSTPLIVTNNCGDDIYPGITTQSGNGPDSTGFKLSPGDQNKLSVSENWQGRVWGRTNCSFNDQGTGPSNNSPGKACGTGDCNGVMNCKVTVC